MNMCKKGLHDLDEPGVLVKNGINRKGVCGPCKAARVAQIWRQQPRRRSTTRTSGKLVCDFGHIFLTTTTRLSRNETDQVVRRVCKICEYERKQAHLGKAPPRVRPSKAFIASQQTLAETMSSSELVTLPALEGTAEMAPDVGPFDPQPWADKALCADGDPEIFFPEDPRDQTALRRARKICVECSVWQDCREYAIRRDEVWGIWGGMNRPERVAEAERRKLLPLTS